MWAIVLTFGGGSSNVSFFMAMTLTVIVYLAAYFLFFLAYINLVLKKRNLKRAYEIPGGIVVKLILAIIGLIFSAIAFIISFLPPSGLQSGSIGEYTTILIVCFAVTMVLPFIIYYAFKGRKIKATSKNVETKVS